MSEISPTFITLFHLYLSLQTSSMLVVGLQVSDFDSRSFGRYLIWQVIPILFICHTFVPLETVSITIFPWLYKQLFEISRLYYSVSLLKHQLNFQRCKYPIDKLDLQILTHGHKFQESWRKKCICLIILEFLYWFVWFSGQRINIRSWWWTELKCC